MTIIQLCRYGDIFSVLPAVMLARPVQWIVNEYYADAIQGIDGIEVIQVREANPTITAQKYPEAVIPQVHGNPRNMPRAWSSNYQDEMFARLIAGGLDLRRSECWSLPLTLTNRNLEFEAEIWRGYPATRILFSGVGLSSPHPDPYSIAEQLGPHIELSRIRCNQIHNLCGLMDRVKRAGGILVSVDTVHLHLAYAVGIPTIGIVNDDPWLATRRRDHWIAGITYSESMIPGRIREIVESNL